MARIPFSLAESMAGTTGLEPATSAVTGQRSNQTELRPQLFSSHTLSLRKCCLPLLSISSLASISSTESNSGSNGQHENLPSMLLRMTCNPGTSVHVPRFKLYQTNQVGSLHLSILSSRPALRDTWQFLSTNLAMLQFGHLIHSRSNDQRPPDDLARAGVVPPIRRLSTVWPRIVGFSEFLDEAEAPEYRREWWSAAAA
jgi:hypothetical protein